MTGREGAVGGNSANSAGMSAASEQVMRPDQPFNEEAGEPRPTAKAQRTASTAAESIHRHCVEAFPGALLCADREGSLVMVNERLARLFGYPCAAELLDGVRSVFELFFFEAPSGVDTGIEALVERARGGAAEADCCVLMRDGTRKHVQIHMTAVGEEAGLPFALVGMVLDITERKAAQDALLASQAKYRALVEMSPDAIVVTDLQGRMIMTNLQAARMNGVDSAEALLARGLTGFDLIAPEDRARALAVTQLTLQHGIVRNVEYRLLRGDGSTFPAELSSAVIRGADGRPEAFIAIVRDTTERVKAAEERRKLDAKLQHAQKLDSLGVLAGGFAHDFNNLLGGILGYSALAERCLPPQSPARPHVQQVQLAARQAADLTRQILAYSGRGTFRVDRVDLSSVVAQIAQLLRVSIPKKVSLVLELTPKLTPILADVAQVQQVVMNLLTNASEAIGDSCGRITMRSFERQVAEGELIDSASNDTVAPGRYVTLRVMDDGCGMDAATLRTVFDPFFTTKFTGRGLGLASALGIMRGHRGAIVVQSQPGCGTTFEVLFPCGQEPVSEGADVPAPSSPKLHTLRSMGPGTVLVADDEPFMRAMVKVVLEEAGFHVVEAMDGSEAVRKFREASDTITAILLDVTMPQMDGPETLVAVRKINPDVPVLLVSGYSEQDVVSRLQRHPPAAFLQKPFGPDDLLCKLRDLLSDKPVATASLV
jgi:two-component system, cell cycle sensor histidine kinase and response regulator CckA